MTDAILPSKEMTCLLSRHPGYWSVSVSCTTAVDSR